MFHRFIAFDAPLIEIQFNLARQLRVLEALYTLNDVLWQIQHNLIHSRAPADATGGLTWLPTSSSNCCNSFRFCFKVNSAMSFAASTSMLHFAQR
jgi:hypothetical protein